MPSGDLQSHNVHHHHLWSHNVHHHRHLPPHCLRCWVLQGHGVLTLIPIYAALVLPSVSAYCALVHRVGHYPYSLSGQSGKPTPWCQRQTVLPCSANGNSPPVIPFRCHPGMCPLPPSLPLEHMPRGSWPHGTTRYEVATGSLHPAEPQAPLPAGYPNDSANSIAGPVCDARCLPVSPCAHCLLNAW